jgi:hypothetical protein
MQAETLRDSFPASDKSLSRLLTEVPYLPESIFKLLEHLCCPGSNNKDEESHSVDRLTQGLSIVWSLILVRPPIRNACLKIALQVSFYILQNSAVLYICCCHLSFFFFFPCSYFFSELCNMDPGEYCHRTLFAEVEVSRIKYLIFSHLY